ncbi:MAG: hypothetical protein WBF21_04435 [Steroidobacteraceae bacterium]
MPETLQYDIEPSSEASISKICALAEQVWRDLQAEGSSARRAAATMNIDVADLPARLDQALVVKASGAGFDPTSIVLMVTGAATGAVSKQLSRVVMDLWKYVILPQVRARWGDRSLKERRQAATQRKRRAAPKSRRRGHS